MFGCFRVLIRSLCKMSETVLQLVILVVNIVVGPGSVQLVQSVILIVKFSRAWGFLGIPIGCLVLVRMTGMVHSISHYSYC